MADPTTPVSSAIASAADYVFAHAKNAIELERVKARVTVGAGSGTLGEWLMAIREVSDRL